MRRIFLYIAEENPSAADGFVVELEQKVRSLTNLGLSGVQREGLDPDIRTFVYRNQCIYFTITDEALRVLRVLHARRKISRDYFSD